MSTGRATKSRLALSSGPRGGAVGASSGSAAPRVQRQMLAVAALAALGFAATLAVSLWIERGPTAPAPAPAALPGHAVLPRLWSWLVPRAPSASSGAAAPAPALSAPRAAAAPDSDADVPLADAGGAPLPIMLAISSRPAQIVEEAEDGTASSTRLGVARQVDLYSKSDEPLQITVLTTNLPTQETTRAQVFVLPHGQAHLDTESGLKLDPGDLVAVRSSGYQELTETVR